MKAEQVAEAEEESKLLHVSPTANGRKKTTGTDGNKTISFNRQLCSMKHYGTRAQDIYDACCSFLGFDSSKRGKFGMLQELYAMDATAEGYSLWFLAHSNWTATSNGKWSNEIHKGIKKIDEFWDDTTIGRFDEDSEIRVTFAKKKNGDYVFLGIYKCLYIDKVNQVKRYEIIADKYPECIY